jgi:hypothetical protein
MAPMITDFLAMVQGSGEIYPYSYPYGWFNGRYLIFLAPLFAFASAALVMFELVVVRFVSQKHKDNVDTKSAVEGDKEESKEPYYNEDKDQLEEEHKSLCRFGITISIPYYVIDK